MTKNFKDVYTFNNIYKAYKESQKGKRHKTEVIKFNENYSQNLIECYKKIKNNTYSGCAYKEFKIYYSKERLIMHLHLKIE